MGHYAWVLEVRPGCEEEYKKAHDEIWPEMLETLKAAGIRNYSIFRLGLKLIGYFETDDLQKTIAYLKDDPVNKRWGEAMARAVLPAMLDRGGGAIVNLSSGAAHRAMEGWSAYCAAKAGLAMVTKSLALEYGARGIRAFGFAPGIVDTGMQVEIRASGINPVSKLPREGLASVDDPAKAIVFLCTSAAGDLAGLEVDIREASFRERAGLPALPAA
ncbi:MAG: SDR family NAD(P)-dependent oxidoreductase [Rhizobiales bacterium]|nr:SDR family NAD(P)-dependent oxidoreductase [Hyphomicrobiales bacterium]